MTESTPWKYNEAKEYQRKAGVKRMRIWHIILRDLENMRQNRQIE